MSNHVMTRKLLPTKLLFFLGVTAFLLQSALHVAQQAEGSAALKTFVGTWKEIDPPKAIAIKRDLDQIMYANKVLFSDELFAAYHESHPRAR